MRRLGVPLIALALALAPAAAGSVGDHLLFDEASDDRSDPTPVEEGEQRGLLAPPGDADWYRLNGDGGGPACVEVHASGDANAKLDLDTPNGEDYLVTGNLTPDKPVHAGLAVPQFDGATFGLYPFEEVRSVGSYSLQVQTTELAPGQDEGAGAAPEQDAGAASGGTEDPKPCRTGRVGPGESDRFQVDVDAGDRLTVSVAQPDDERPVQASLEDPEGTVRDSAGTGGEDPAVVHVRADQAGTWEVSSMLANENAQGGAPYLVGISVVDDCQLYCAVDGFAQDDDECDEENEENEDECDDDNDRGCEPYCMAGSES
jgi:hypothetical protein